MGGQNESGQETERDADGQADASRQVVASAPGGERSRVRVWLHAARGHAGSALRALRESPQLPHALWSIAACGLLIGLADVVRANATLSFPSVGARGAHAFYDLFLIAGLGALADLFFSALSVVERKSKRLALVVLSVASGALGYELMERNFSRQASLLLNGKIYELVIAAIVIACAVGMLALVALARILGQRWWTGLLGAAFAVGGSVANVLYFVDDYHEAHTAVVLVAMTFAGLCSRWAFAGERRWPSHTAKAVVGLALVASVVPPSNATRLSLFGSPGSAGAWLYGQHVWRLPPYAGELPASVEQRWLEPRAADAQLVPSSEPLVSGKPVVVLLTIDALRADVFENPEHMKLLPAFSRLQREGAMFSEARSPGSQTSVSLTALFAGKYFSEMKWERFGDGKNRFEYAAADPSPRFTDLLNAAGVATFKVVSLMFLRNEYGVAPGFSEELVVTEGRKHARGTEVVPPMVERLRRAGSEPLFMFAHLTEPHAPYDRGKLRFGPRFDRYLAEIVLADQFVGQLLATLSATNLRDRAILIVSSDHGEAFGEHGTFEHTKTIYDEMVRVPLFIWGKGVAPRKIDQRVTLIDLNPTILDIFGVVAPDTATAQSLVPLLSGKELQLTRPIFGEGRLRRSLVLEDTKVVVDLRRTTIEAFDLKADPLELDSFYDRDPERAKPFLAVLAAFFERRGYSKDGYRPVYKP